MLVMQAHPTMSQHKLDPSKKEAIACFKVIHAKLLNIPLPNQENMAQLKPLLLVIFSLISGIDIFTNKKYEDGGPTASNIMVPNVSKM
jgi:hypothetical protein